MNSFLGYIFLIINYLVITYDSNIEIRYKSIFNEVALTLNC